MTKRKAEDDNVWFVLEDDGGIKSIAKNSKTIVDDGKTIVYEDGIVQSEIEEEVVDHVESIAIEQIAFAETDGEYYEVYEEEHGDDERNASTADDSRTKPEAQLVVQNSENVVAEDPEPSKFGCGSSWTDAAVLTMLSHVEPFLDDLKKLPPQRHREIWDKIGESLAPHQHSGMDCLLKFRNMKRAYRKLLLRKARNFPVHWKFFNRMHSLLQAEVPKVSQKTDARSSPKAGSSDINKNSSTAESSHISEFDSFLAYKREILEEVKSQGAVVKRHLEEMALSNDRRERKENEIYTLLKTIVTEEEKKVDLFRKLLDRLW